MTPKQLPRKPLHLNSPSPILGLPTSLTCRPSQGFRWLVRHPAPPETWEGVDFGRTGLWAADPTIRQPPARRFRELHRGGGIERGFRLLVQSKAATAIPASHLAP